MLRFRVLGPLQVLRDRAPLPLGAPKQRVLLAALLLHRSRLVPRDELVDVIWGSDPPESAVPSLQVYVHGLRRVLGSERIETRGVAYRIRMDDGELDLADFERLVDRARHSLSDGTPEVAAASLREALDLWQGPPLGDLAPDKLVAERAQLEEHRLSGLELLIDADLARGEHEQLIAQLTALIAEHPFRERLREQRIIALYRAGRQKEALESYREARRAFLEELGIEPGPRLRELEAAVLRQDPALAAPSAAGRHKPVELPAPPTRLIGREQEITEILALFVDDGARLVTLTGPGGTGKTRLALAVAERLAGELAHGGRFVDLSPVSDPSLVLPTIADALEVPGGERPLAQAIGEQLRRLRTLLVLDNLEQVLPAATVVSDLLTAAPGLLILATSRVCLSLRAEHEYPVPPLQLPDPGAGFAAIAGNEAVRLLTERARAVNRSCTLTEASAPAFVHICRRLDGLPLAIELAASRLRTLSPEGLATALDRALELLVEGPRDLPARQRTLRATVEWSHDMLGGEERRVFAHLAVFAGSFTGEDAGALCGAGVARTLRSLVEVNLVRQVEGERFAMLETIREYALECLKLRGEESAARAQHCRHFLALAEDANEAIMTGEESESAYAALADAHDNLRAALTWAGHAGELELQVRLACALRQFWLVRGHLDEGRTFFELAVDATNGNDPSLRARALVNGGPFLYRQGRLEQARAWWEEAHTLLSGMGDRAGAARCAGELGGVAFSEGDLDRAAELYRSSAEGFAELGDQLRVAIVSSNLAEVSALRGDLPGATEHAEHAVAIFRGLGDPDGLAVALNTLARLRESAGEMCVARQLFAECLVHAQAIGYREVIANCVQAAADPALELGDSERAARLLAVARTATAEMGVRLQGLEGESFARTAGAIAEHLEPERVRSIEAQAAGLELDAVVDEALELLRASSRASVN